MITNKVCSKCKIEKPFSEFHKNPQGKYGYKSVCMKCTHLQRKERYSREDFDELKKKWSKDYYTKNREKVLKRTTEYRRNRPELYQFYWNRWIENNSERLIETKHIWKTANKHLIAQYAARYRASKLRATPLWAKTEFEEFCIEEIYKLSVIRTNSTGIRHSVDHIVPLNSKIVCGLHCVDNLRVITLSENSSKSNRYWPDMP